MIYFFFIKKIYVLLKIVEKKIKSKLWNTNLIILVLCTSALEGHLLQIIETFLSLKKKKNYRDVKLRREINYNSRKIRIFECRRYLEISLNPEIHTVNFGFCRVHTSPLKQRR